MFIEAHMTSAHEDCISMFHVRFTNMFLFDLDPNHTLEKIVKTIPWNLVFRIQDQSLSILFPYYIHSMKIAIILHK